MKKWLVCAAALAVLAGESGVAMAEAQGLPVLSVPVLSAAPSMTGMVDSSWKGALALSLATDYTYRRPTTEPTDVYVAQDHGSLDVAFVVTQHDALTATQHSNGSAVISDDYVGVELSPQGNSGFSYTFSANPRGARDQTSSENSAYAPGWTAGAKITPTGYTVTMRIPLSVIRSGGSTSWRVQFLRQTVSTGGLAVWAYSPAAKSSNDPTFFGTLSNVGAGLALSKGSTRPQPRVQLYGLGELTTPAYGGNTSHVGADIAIPVTPTASFVATLHPDYSNVEVDQQTISPTAFARQYAEVRPFFTQVGTSFNRDFSCTNCPQTLYTPSIPTFSQGYAIEGTQGRYSFGSFDAIGRQRNDQAETLNYDIENEKYAVGADFQRVGVDLNGLHDVTTTFGTGYLNQHTHFGVYANTGVDRGTLVTDAGQANYFEDGMFYVTSTTTFTASYQRIGEQFSPFDGFVPQNDTMGYEVYGMHLFTFSPKSALHDIMFTGFENRFDNHFGQLAQANFNPQINFDFRDLLTLHAFVSSEGVRTFNNELLPFDTNGLALAYRLNTATPTSIQYQGGPYYHGTLDSWSYLSTLPVVRRVHLSLEADSTKYLTNYVSERNLTQWLERASLDFQISKDAQFDVGARRIIGGNLPNAFQAPAFGTTVPCGANPYTPGCYINAGNVSLAFHFLAAHNEFYVVYGDPNSLGTTPALFFKWIRYIGAEKGT